MKVLITLGPTQEPIDSVRYITTGSSGRMGKSLANEAIKREFSTTLLAGPISLGLPKKAKIIRVKTADQMIKKTLKELKKNYDIFISAAAIADFTPLKVRKGKIKSNEPVQIKLKPNPKLTSLSREKFPQLFIVAFKAEHSVSRNELIKRGFEKLLSENLNLIIANDLSISLDKKNTEVYLIDKIGIEHLPLNSKEIIAKRIWNKILSLKNES